MKNRLTDIAPWSACGKLASRGDDRVRGTPTASAVPARTDLLLAQLQLFP